MYSFVYLNTHEEIYERNVGTCSLPCGDGVKAVHQLRCRTSSLKNQTICSDIGFSLRGCTTGTRKECPGMHFISFGHIATLNVKHRLANPIEHEL